MSEEDGMHPTGAIETIPALGQLRADLLTAVERDRSKAARRRKVVLAAVIAVVAIGAVGSAIAAATGAFSPAPPDVQQKFADLGPEVDESRAIAIGTIDEHAAYAAPTENGGFCLYFASNPSRSGPDGPVCTTKEPGPTEIALNVQPGHDGGFVFGRVGTDEATSVEIELPGRGGTVATPVREDRFFLLELPPSAMPALTGDGAVIATAKNEDGKTLARGTGRVVPMDVPTDTTRTDGP
jgi:hypothetical protein